MDQPLRSGFRVGEFDVDPLAGQISGPGGTRHLQPKVMDVLVSLAERAGELVERDELLARVWGRPTTLEVLTRCISELRRALGDDRGRPRYIQTVPKRGYRLVERIEPVTMTPAPSAARGGSAAPDRSAAAAAGSASARAASAGGLGPPAPDTALASVAVLPFDDLSGDGVHRHIADGFAAELQSTLARVDRLRVASRRSAFAVKSQSLDVREIGQRLGVRYVISGSLQCTGVDLRIIAALDDAVTGHQVWTQSYDRKSGDLLAIEREVAETVVAAFTTQHQLAEMLSARATATSNLDAWGLVQKSRALALEYTQESLTGAIAPLHQAIELDPLYAAAHATLGSLLVERLINGLGENLDGDEAAALAAASTATELAPRDPFVLKMLGLVWAYCGEPRKSIASLRKAVELTPFDFGAWGYFGWPLTATGDAADLEQLDSILRRLLALEPQHPGAAFWLYHESVADCCRQNFESAQRLIERAIEQQPAFALGFMHYANVLGQQGRDSEARDALARCAALNPRMTVAHYDALVRKLSRDADVVAARSAGLAHRLISGGS